MGIKTDLQKIAGGSGGDGLEDAPADNKYYVRKDEMWVEAGTGGDEASYDAKVEEIAMMQAIIYG